MLSIILMHFASSYISLLPHPPPSPFLQCTPPSLFVWHSRFCRTTACWLFFFRGLFFCCCCCRHRPSSSSSSSSPPPLPSPPATPHREPRSTRGQLVFLVPFIPPRRTSDYFFKRQKKKQKKIKEKKRQLKRAPLPPDNQMTTNHHSDIMKQNDDTNAKKTRCLRLLLTSCKEKDNGSYELSVYIGGVCRVWCDLLCSVWTTKYTTSVYTTMPSFSNRCFENNWQFQLGAVDCVVDLLWQSYEFDFGWSSGMESSLVFKVILQIVSFKRVE